MVIETFKEDFIFNFLSFYFAAWRNLDLGKKKKAHPKWDEFVFLFFTFFGEKKHGFFFFPL